MSVDAYGLLVEEFKSEEVQDQLAAAKRINTIAINMGPDRSRSQLLPFLRACVDEYTDEVLMAIAEGAGGLVSAVGGGETAHSLLPLLEALADKEETVVRAKAVESLVQVGKSMPGATIQEQFVPLVKRLAAGEFFTSRISAAGLFATIYPSTPAPIRPALRKQYEQLAKDDMPMVRSAAFAHMPALAEVLEKDVLISEMSPLFNELSSDVQESVREMAVDNVVKMVKFLSPEEAARLFGTFFDNIQNEKSFTMRLNKAKNFVTIAQAMHPARNIRDQVQAFLQLMAIDAETEVRSAAAKNLGGLCVLLDGHTVLGQILPVVRELCQNPSDPQAQVSFQANAELREHIADNICSVAPVLGREATMNELLPVIKVFFADESIEIRRKVLATIAPVVETMGSEAVDASLLPDVLRMAEDPQWRVRLSIVMTLPTYAKHLGLDLFNSRLMDIELKALSDQIAHIREVSVQNLEVLVKLFGEDWMQENIMPSISDASKRTGPSGYLGRITALHAVGVLSGVMPPAFLVDTLLPQIAVPLSRDRVVNVRIAAGEALAKCANRLASEGQSDVVNSVISPALSDLSNDTDPDVKKASQR
mmetsp:Transcript_13747/g.33723  ORF Transcript_13747/g.33723 Transcript_13747/m.33723 type:complete len:592 (-) Transcript_13747:368-2143(-)